MGWNSEELRAELEAYERALVAAGRAPGAITTYVGQSRRFLDWLDGKYSPRGGPPPVRRRPPGARAELADLRADLVAYAEVLRAAGQEPATVRTYVDQSGRFLAWLAGTY